MHRTIVTATSLVAFVGLAVADDHNIQFADLAPAGAGLVLSIPSYSAMNDAFLRTPLAEWWESEEVQDWIDELITDAIDEMNADFEELELDRDDFSMPTGAAGFALWAVPPSEGDEGALHFIAAADFGADGIETTVETFDGLIEEARESGDVEIEETDFGDAIIYTFREVEDEDNEDEDMDDFMAEFEDFEDDEPFAEVHIVRAGSFMIVSSSMEDLENAIDRINGEAFDSFADQAAYGEATSEFEDAHAHLILANAPWYEAQRGVDEMNADNEFSMAPPVMQMLEATGLSKVRGGAAALYIDTDKGIAETPFIVRADGLDGLLSLVDLPAKPLTPPAFVGGDVAGVTLLQVELSELLPTFRAAASRLDPEHAAQLNQQVAFFGGIAGPILDELGPEIYVIQSLKRPFSADSQQTTTAIRVADSGALTNAIAGPAESFLGLKPREFQGAQIFSSDQSFVEVAIGITRDFLFVGPVASVEDAIRQAANPAGVTLANEDRFKNAMGHMSAEGLSFTWSDTKSTLEYLEWTSKNHEQIIRAQIEAWAGPAGYTDEEIDEMVEQQAGEPPFEIPNLDLLIDVTGDSVQEVRVTPDGFRGNGILLRAE